MQKGKNFATPRDLTVGLRARSERIFATVWILMAQNGPKSSKIGLVSHARDYARIAT
jgi:hypothetical protein